MRDYQAEISAERLAAAARYCPELGHELDVIVDETGEPHQVICGRCRRTWTPIPDPV